MSKCHSCEDFLDLVQKGKKMSKSKSLDNLPDLIQKRSVWTKSMSCEDLSSMQKMQKVRAFNRSTRSPQLEFSPSNVVAHRGGAYIAPENTAGALKAGLKNGAKGVEFDLQSTSDGHLVVLHDDTLERTAVPYAQAFEASSCPMDEAEYNRILRTDVNALDLETIQKVDISGVLPAWPQREFVITFEEAIHIVQSVKGAFCFAEIKKGDTQSADRAATVVAKTKASPGQVIFISFSLPTISRMKKLLPSFTCLHVMDLKPSMKVSDIKDQIQMSLDSGIDGVDLCAYPEVVTSKLGRYVNSRGKRLDVWVSSKVPGMDSMKNMLLMAQNGVQHFTTDMPTDIIEWIRESSAP